MSLLFLTASQKQTNKQTRWRESGSMSQARLQSGGISDLRIAGRREVWMTMGLLGSPRGDRYEQQDHAAASVCCSQQPQSPTWNLEPRQPGEAGAAGAAGLTSATGCRDRGAKAQTHQPEAATFPWFKSRPAGDLHVPLLSIILAQNRLHYLPSSVTGSSSTSFSETLETTPTYPHLKSTPV